MSTTECPHCGNKNSKTIESNGLASSDPDFGLLCIARVKPADRSWDHDEPAPDQIDADGLVACGMQWSPNEG